MIKRLLLIMLSLLTFFSLSIASDSNVGTSGAQFLKIGAGARPTAMGQAFVGIADDVNAVYFNPAGLGFLSRPELTAMHTQWIQGLNYDFGAFAYPTDQGAFAISAATLRADDLEKRGLDESHEGSFESLDSAYALSYARNINATLSAGITARLIKQEIDTASADAWAGDFGLLKRLHTRPISIGLAIRNFGQDVKFRDEGDPLPTTIDAGVGLELLEQRLKLGFNVQKPRDNKVQFGFGTEWLQPLGQDFAFALRGGYTTQGTDADGTTGMSFGGGFGYRNFDLDFAWVPFGDLGNTFRYAAHVRF